MEFDELIAKRYSVRAYTSKPVEDDKLQKVLDAARLAPTACNIQPFKLIVAKTRGRENELRKIYKADWFVQAPVIICGCTVPSQAWVRNYDNKNHADIDLAIVMDHLILAATDLGLGTCWIAAFDPEAAREVLNIPDDLVPAIFTPLGYPADVPREKHRKTLDDLVITG
ncbi:nitroreductase family protein [bacterium]|nr:nitroreductase family protein [bacterium]